MSNDNETILQYIKSLERQISHLHRDMDSGFQRVNGSIKENSDSIKEVSRKANKNRHDIDTIVERHNIIDRGMSVQENSSSGFRFWQDKMFMRTLGFIVLIGFIIGSIILILVLFGEDMARAFIKGLIR